MYKQPRRSTRVAQARLTTAEVAYFVPQKPGEGLQIQVSRLTAADDTIMGFVYTL